MYHSIIIFAVLCGVYSIPVTFPVCHLNNPDFDNCLKEAIETTLKLLKSGAPEYGLPPFEPLKIEGLVFPAGKSAVHLDQNYKNVETDFDLSNTKVTSANYDPKQKFLKFTTLHPKITQKGDFQTKGQLLVIPINGGGPSVTVLYNMVFNHEISFDEVKKNGETYFKIKSYRMKGDPDKITYKFEGVLGSDKTLNENINNVLNENWRDIWLDVRKQVRQAYANIIKKLAQKFFDIVPVKDIFPQ